MCQKSLIALVFILLLVVQVGAQEKEMSRFSFEFASGIVVPTKKINDSNFDVGLGFDGLFLYRVISKWGVFAGWGWNKMEVEESYVGKGVCYDETGYVFGIQYSNRVGKKPLSYYLRGGGLHKHIEIEKSDGEIIDDTGHGLGWQVGGGILYSLNKKWGLTTGVNYSSLVRETDLIGSEKEINYKYVSLKIGLIYCF